MYPSIQPHHTTMLHVDTLPNGKKVELYVECSGNKNGIPVIYLHGGPGDHITPRHRRWYDPKAYHIILWDQRGTGQSKPTNHTERNTSKLLIRDMEKIRKYVGVDKWVVAGGSWGSSLAMMYAQEHPDRVMAMILRGIYDLSKQDVLDSMWPEQKDQLHDVLNIKSDRQEQTRMNQVLSRKTRKRRKLIRLMTNDDVMTVFTPPKKLEYKETETMTIIGNHYDANNYFVPKDTIYKNMHKIKHIPTIMVEGRYDMVTPMEIAYKLSKMMDDCQLMIVRAGHATIETEITKGLVKASDYFKRKL
jgi:proline iminopeptidase